MAMFGCCAPSDTGNEEMFDTSGTNEYGAVVLPEAALSQGGQRGAGRDAEAPAAAPEPTKEGELGDREFTVKINKTTIDTPLGCHLDISDGVSLRVCGIRSGSSPVQTYNSERGTLPEVKVGDFILQVNAVKGVALELGEEIRRSKALELLIRRPYQFQVTLSKGESSLGLDLNYAMKGTSLVIDKIAGSGAAQDWNAANPDKVIKRHDHIVAVSGVESTSVDLLDMLGKSKEVTLTIARPFGC